MIAAMATSSNLVPIVLDCLDHDPEQDLFRTELTEEWVFYGRVFGGYLSALSAAAAGRVLPEELPLLSVGVTFLSSVRPGPVVLRPALVHRRAATLVVQVTLEQNGTVTSISQVRFGKRKHPELAIDLDLAPPLPDQCVPPQFVRDNASFLAHFDERVIDFPLKHEEFRGGPPMVELWSRPEAVVEMLPYQGQLHDLMIFDSHLLDSVFRVLGWVSWGVRIVSLDLNVTWLRPGSSAGWRRLRARSEIGGDVAEVTANLYGEDGGILAVAASQVAILQRQ
jgi:acyl-CoA thioesterase